MEQKKRVEQTISKEIKEQISRTKERGRCCDTDPTKDDPPGFTNIQATDRRPNANKIRVDALVAHNCGIRNVWIYPVKVTVDAGGNDVYNFIQNPPGTAVVQEVTPTSPCDPPTTPFQVQHDFNIAGLYVAGDTASFEIVPMSCCGEYPNPGQYTNKIVI